MTSRNSRGNGTTAILAILVMGVAVFAFYALFLSPEGIVPRPQPSPHAIDQLN